MDWTEFGKTALTVAGSGGSAFIGAFFRFKQRLADAEGAAKAAKQEADSAKAEALAARAETAALKASMEALTKGWRMEFDDFKEDYEKDKKHRLELDEAVAEARQSRPDPTEALGREVDELKKTLERLRERQARYVRNEQFVEHTRAQETQWKEIARTLGRLEALAK